MPRHAQRRQLVLSALCLMLSLSGCMALVIKAPDGSVPVSLSGQIGGYRTGQQLRHFAREIWTYHLLGLPALPLWTREGLPADDLINPLLREYARPGQGVIRLKVRHSRTALTWLATILTLGLLSPTAVQIEGDVVELERLPGGALPPTSSPGSEVP